MLFRSELVAGGDDEGLLVVGSIEELLVDGVVGALLVGDSVEVGAVLLAAEELEARPGDESVIGMLYSPQV